MQTRMEKKFNKVIIASNNKHKIEEIKAIIGDYFEEVLSLKEASISIDVEENGTTFEENAYIKAKAIFDIAHEAVIADDSGLEVYALNGAPGVFSARYSGEHGNDDMNNHKLLEELRNVPEEKRGARFVCSIVLLTNDGRRINADGYIEGRIGYNKKGNNGFGYDPLFIIPQYNKTLAELMPAEKNAISHRSMALKDLKSKL